MCIDSYADISIHTPTRGTTAGTGTATNLAEFQSTFPREERPYYTIVRIQVLQFQSTLPREERPFPTDFVTAFMPYFNPRSHERSDYSIGFAYPRRTNFNPRSHERSDQESRTQFFINIDFNPRSHERSDKNCLLYINLLLYFNPRSHERSDAKWDLINDEILISIHAPTRGATYYNYSQNSCLAFQSTLPREERLMHSTPLAVELNFNPRSHERSDSNIAQKICLFLYNTDNKYIIR